MTTLRDAAQQALEALEGVIYRIERDLEHGHEWAVVERELASEAITALRAALAEPVQAPVAWLRLRDGKLAVADGGNFGNDWIPLYTAPPQRKPLTDEEMRECFTSTNTCEPLDEGWQGLERFARAIERAHGIGGQP